MWCVPKLTPEYIARMEDVLDLYAQPYNKKEPVLCFDEKSKELRKDSRTLIPTKKGVVRRRDYEYVRNGTANIFMTVEPRSGYRGTQVTARRTRADFAREIKRMVRLPRYRKAKIIHFVLDNLNTHNEQSLIETFGARETARLMKKIKFHHTPKHASWLNMAEIELSIMEGQCTKGRIADIATLKKKLGVWQRGRNQQREMINWRFTKKDARRKFGYNGSGGKLS